jgi:S-(hydroxymethyl)glutathione dehydrogenase/alcohol dehydrogenase
MRSAEHAARGVAGIAGPRSAGAAAAGSERATSAEALEVQAVVLRAPGRPVSLERVLLEPPRAGEVLVRMAAAGVCHSDLLLAEGALGEGRWPLVLGHEGAGVVEALGPGVSGVRAGDRVVLCMIPACGGCGPCRAGRRTLCEVAGAASLAGTLLDGSFRLRDQRGEPLQHGLLLACFATRTVVPAGSVVPLAASIPLWQAALLGCGALTGFGAVDRAGVRIGQSVAVIGCGGVGLQVIAAARLAGAGTIVAIDREAAKLELARRRGATHALLAGEERALAAEVAAICGAGGAEHCFEVVGRPQTIRQAFALVRPGGAVTVVGLAPRGVEVSLPAIDFLSEKAIAGCYYGSGDPRTGLERLIALAAAGRLELGEVVSHFAPLAGVGEALARLARGEGARTVLLIDEQLAGRSL